MLARRGFTRPMERLLFAMVANRALDPGSKLAMETWVTESAHVPGLPEVEVHQLYGAMDFLLEAHEELQKAVFFNVATLLNLEDEVKRDLNGWKLGRVMVVADAGFNSEKNRRLLQCAGGHYILGEKLRPGSAGTPAEALSRSGRFRTLDNGLEIKEVTVGGDGAKARRYVIVRNPEEVRRDKAKRDDIVAEVEWRLAELKNLADVPHEKAACALRSHHVYGRYVTQTPTGRLTLHREKIKTEELVDGKFLVSSSDDTLSAEDIVLGYKALWRVERAFRDLKHVLDIRPVYHRLSDRIRAHVLLCWLALLLVRVAENETGQTWGHLRRVLDRLQVGIHQTKHGEVWQTSRMDKEHIELFETLKIKAPPRFLAIPRLLKDPPSL